MAKIRYSSGGAGALSMQLEQFTGSDGSGSDGAINRVITTSSVTDANGEILVFVDRQSLRKTEDFTVSGNNVTFLIKLWDAQEIDLNYID